MEISECQTPGPQLHSTVGTSRWSARPQEGGCFLVQRTSSPPFSLSCPVPTLTPALLSLHRLLIAGTGFSTLEQILILLKFTKDLLLTSSYLSDRIFTGEHIKSLVTQYLNITDSHWCSWSVSTMVVGEGAGGVLEERGVGRRGQWLWGSSARPFLQSSQAGLLTSVVPVHLLRLYQMLFFTLPGTPVFNYGDEIGLEAALPGQVLHAASPAQWGGCVHPSQWFCGRRQTDLSLAVSSI